MKKVLSPLALGIGIGIGIGIGLLCIGASPAQAESRNAPRAASETVDGEGSREIHWYSVQVNGRYSIQGDAEREAKDNAKKNFEEKCKNTRNGEPKNVVALVPYGACRYEFDSSDRFIKCTARARGICEVKPVERNPRVTERRDGAAPSEFRMVTDEKGNQFIIGPDGAARPVVNSTSARE